MLEFPVEPGRTIEGSIAVSGDDEEPLRVRVNVGDMQMDRRGELSFPEPGRTERSLAKWLTVTPNEFVLSRGKRQMVRYRLQVPREAVGSYWGIVFFQTVPTETISKGKVGILTAARLTTMVFASTTSGGTRDGRIVDTTVQILPGGKLKMGLTFENLGNLLVHIKGRYEIRDAKSGKVAAKIPLDERIVLPGTAREFTQEWQGKLPPGSYLLLGIADFGGKNVVAGQRAFKIGP